MVDPCVRVGRICRTFPEFGMPWWNMRGFFPETDRRIAPVTIDTTEHHVRSSVHRLYSLMTLQTYCAFPRRLRLSLADPIAGRTLSSLGHHFRYVYRCRWPRCLLRLLAKRNLER